MLEENIITMCVRELGYDRLSSFSYKAIWSTTEVEHFLFFSPYATPKVFLTADFGLRNADAQSFGARSVQVYGGEAYHLVAQDERKQCYMRFPLGKLAGWNPRWSLNLSRI